MRLHLLVISTDHGDTPTLHASEEAAKEAVFEYVAEYWNQDGPGRDGVPLPEDEDAAIEDYFEAALEETYTIVEVDAPNPAPTPAGRDVVIPAAFAERIAVVIDEATDDARREARRIKNAPDSDGYIDDDVDQAEEHVTDLQNLYGELRELREAAKRQPPLPPIVYGENAIESWRTHVTNLQGWNVQITFEDCSHHDGVIRGVGFSDDGSPEGFLHVAWQVDGQEPDENTDTETVLLSKVHEIFVY